MPRKLFISSKFVEFNEYITIGSGGIYFSAEFIKKNNFETSSYVKFYTFDESDYKFGMEFSEQEKVEGGFALVRPKGNINSFYTTARSFTQEVLSLKNLMLSMKGKKKNNRFEITFDDNEKCYIFTIIPTFEYQSSIQSLPQDIFGIYRFRNGSDEVIYIGKGNISTSANSPEREEWGIKKVEYSIVNDEESQKKFEALHLRLHEEDKGIKPIFNL